MAMTPTMQMFQRAVKAGPIGMTGAVAVTVVAGVADVTAENAAIAKDSARADAIVAAQSLTPRRGLHSRKLLFPM
jgi:hypothetical protein